MAVIDAYRPRPDYRKLRDLDYEKLVPSYDFVSDTLVVHFYGRGRSAVPVPSPRQLERGSVFLRFDPETDELVGLQIEEFLRLYLPAHPESFVMLEIAELRGITPEQVVEYGRNLGKGASGLGSLREVVEGLALAA